MGAVKLLYLANKQYKKRGGRLLPQIFKNVCRVIYGCDISYKITLGTNLQLPHQGIGVVVGPDVVIGNHVIIYQNVTIGAKANGRGYTAPTIGDHVTIGAGACILGNVKIGNHVSVGANAVVLTDIPDNCIAVGVPARIRTMEEMT